MCFIYTANLLEATPLQKQKDFFFSAHFKR